jgi:magnesium transporter
VRPDDRVGDVRRELSGRRFDTAVDVAVCEDDRLIGLVSIEQVLALPGAVSMASVMDRDPSVVSPAIDQEVAAWHAVRHGESSVAVVDGTGRFVGLIPPARLLGVVLREHDEDLARLGGFLASTRRAREASEEPLARRFWHRLPWLLVGLAGAMLAAAIVGAFEEDLRRHVALAFFVPAIVYLADAVGTQTEALVIRGLSVGVTIRPIVGREILTGIVIGVVLALVFLPFAWIVGGALDVGIAVSIALLAACAVATAVAMALPWMLQRLGRDPAFGSGPLATVVQDVLSILIYFAVAAAIVV